MARPYGVCLDLPCASPLAFDSLLVSMFAKHNVTGCIGLKVYTSVYSCDGDDGNMCGTELTLPQLIERAIVNDGCDGNALNLFQLNFETVTVTCPVECGADVSLESMLRQLFANNGYCYGLKVFDVSLTCEQTNSFAACSGMIDAEQMIKASLLNEATGCGLFLPYYDYTDTCSPISCDLDLTNDQIVEGLFRQITSLPCGGVVALNLSNVYCTDITDLTECGDHYTFLDALKASLSTNGDCGYALNVFSMGGGLQ